MSYDLLKVVENRAAQEIFLKARFVIFRCPPPYCNISFAEL